MKAEIQLAFAHLVAEVHRALRQVAPGEHFTLPTQGKPGLNPETVIFEAG